MNCFAKTADGVKIFFYLLTLLLSSTLHSNAQNPGVRYIGIENGLSNNAITSIYQDHNGFMWFGTYDGLNRYDGYSFKVFRNIIGDSNSLKSNNVYTIEGDSQHNIWIGAQKGVCIYDPVTSSFSLPKFLSANGTQAQTVNDDAHNIKSIKGNILIGTQHYGLLSFKNKSTIGVQVPLEGKEFDYDVTSMEVDTATQTVYVFIQSRGLYVYDVAAQKLHLLNNTLTEANCLKADNRGGLWIGDNTGFYKYDKRSNHFSSNLIDHNTKVVQFWLDKTGVLWIATDGSGVWSLAENATMSAPLLTEKGLPVVNSNAVYAVYEDPAGRKWFGTLRGGVNIMESRVSSFRKIVYNSRNENNLIENFILSFCEDGKNVWIGTDGAGLRYWDRQKNKFTEYVNNPANKTSISSNFITNITKDYKDDIWLSTWFGGISRFKKSSGSFERYTCYNPITHAQENNAWLIYEDSQKRLWASTTNEGTLYQYNRLTNKFDLFDPTIDNVQCLVEDRAGSLWGGNYTTLIKIDPLHKKHITYPIGYPVRSIHEDKDGNFWIGTQEGGLLLFDRKTEQYKRFTTKDGLPSNTVLRLLEDGKGNLWMSTYNGLAKFDYKNKAFHNFSQSDGLQSNQFSFNGALALRTGEFLFGGIKGFNIFYPDSVYEKFESPKIFLTGLKINNKPVEETESYVIERRSDQIKKITVPYSQAVLSLDYIALEYASTDKIKYAYYLEGWDKAWNDVSHIRTANYSRLQDGKYIFKIKVSNPDGKWSKETQLLEITVLPPWYRTWWAWLLYAVVSFGAGYLYLFYKRRQDVLKYQIKIAHIEAEKEKELNENKLLFFTNISHEFRTPLSLIINPVKDLLHKSEVPQDKQELNIVYHNARRLLRLVDQLLLFRKADSEIGALNMAALNFYDLCKEVYACFIQQAQLRKIDYELLFTNTNLKITGDREKLEIALFNLLSNAFKYTPENGKITLQVNEHAHHVEIVVSDTGIGMPAKTGDKLFEKFYQVKENMVSAGGFGIGLYLVKSFIEAHEGKISYTSKKGEGTAFSIVLQKNSIESGDSICPNTCIDNSALLTELSEDAPLEKENEELPLIQNNETLVSVCESVLIVDDDNEIRQYLVSIFKTQYKVYEASNGEDGIRLAHEHLPDVIISDVIMKGIGGIDLCRNLKEDSTVSHIPVILLTGSSSEENKLQGIESGAEDYIKKPFDKDILVARVKTILKSRNTLQRYFYHEVTLQSNNVKVSPEYKEFLERCIQIVEDHLDDENFSIKTLSQEIGMSHSNLYKKVKSVSGQSVAGFIKFIRLRKAAEILINTENNINQTANIVGFNDVKYFREHFNKLFGMNPSDYIKKFRKPFHHTHKVDKSVYKV